MSMQYVRKTYNVPAKRGMLVCFNGGKLGRITSATNMIHIKACGSNEKPNYRYRVHPTDDIAYWLPSEQWLCANCSDKTIIATQTIMP